MAPAMRSRRTSSFTWNGDSLASMREPLSQWPDLESSNETSADDFSDVPTDNDEDRQQKYRGTPALKLASYESELSDVGECDDRERFRDSLVKVNYNSDSCLTPRSRRTLRRTLSGSTEPWPSAKPPSKAPALDTIFSPTHEILHPLQSLRLERSLSSKSTGVSNEFPTKVYRTSVTFENFTLPKPQSNSRSFDSFMEPSPKPRSTPGEYDSYMFPRNSVEYDSYKFQTPVASTLEEEKLEQKQSLIQGDSDGVDSTPLSTVNEEKSEMEIPTPNIIVIIVDAEKKLTFAALDWAIHVAVRPGDEIIILGVLRHIFSPMGYKLVANTDPLYGVNREFLQLEVNKTTESFESKVSESGRREECEKKKVKLSVRIAPGARARTVVVRELRVLGATYAIFDRKAMRSRRYYGKHLSCHAVRMRRNGRSTKTITLVPQKTSSTKSRSPTSDISSVSSMSTDRTSSESRSPTFWRRITSFRSSRRSRTTSPRSSPRSHRSELSEMQDLQDLDHLSSKLKSVPLAEVPADAYSYEDMDSHRKHLAAISVTIPPAICAT